METEEDNEVELSYQDKVNYADNKFETALEEWGNKLGFNLKVAAMLVAFSVFLIILYFLRKWFLKT